MFIYGSVLSHSMVCIVLQNVAIFFIIQFMLTTKCCSSQMGSGKMKCNVSVTVLQCSLTHEIGGDTTRISSSTCASVELTT